MTQILIANAALLIILSTLYGLLNLIQNRPQLKKLLTGVLFGVITILGMFAPLRLPDGIIYDGRSIILTLAGLFGGGRVALIAAAMAGVYRLSLGGTGVWAGIATIAACSLVGLLIRRRHKNHPEQMSLGMLYLVGVITHVVMLSCQLLIPWPRAFEVLAEIWFPILMIFPLTTFLIGLILKNEEDRHQTHLNLQSSQALYRDLVETAQDLIWQCDIEGRYTYLNPAWEEVFGYKIEEMLGKSFSEFQTPEYAESDFNEYKRLLTKKTTIKGIESAYVGKDGQLIWLVFNMKFQLDEQGIPIGAQGTAHDITRRKQVRSELEAISTRNKDILASVPDIIMEVDNNKVYTWSNLVGIKFFGENVVGKEASFYFEGEQETYSIVQPLFDGSTDDVVYVESWQRRIDGEKRLLAWWCQAIKDVNGKITGTLSTARDITKQRQAEEEIQQESKNLEALLEISQALTSKLDMQSIQQMIVESAVKITGLDTGALYLLRGEEIYLGAAEPPLPPQFPKEYRQAKLADHPHIQLTIANGQPIILPDTEQANLTKAERGVCEARGLRSILYVPLMIETKSVGTLILSSIGKTHSFSRQETNLSMTLASQAALSIENARLFEEIQNNALELEKRVAERTAKLQIANNDLESFTYSVSHDLRAPLRAINGFAEIIAHRHHSKLNNEGRHYFDNIIKASQQMEELIDALLSYARLGQKSLHREPVALHEILMDLVSEFQPALEKTKGKIDIAKDLPTLVGDRTLFRQIFSNLLDNAIKYHAVGSAPNIDVSWQVEDKAVILAVKDNGIGIPVEYQDKIFNIFQRLHPLEEYPGTGIGLAAVRKSVELLGGIVWVESQPEKGSTFFVKLTRE